MAVMLCPLAAAAPVWYRRGPVNSAARHQAPHDISDDTTHAPATGWL